LDMWVFPIIDGSRNSDLIVVDCSEHIQPLEVPTFKVDASHGDLHPHGNPHYWLGPDNIPAVLETIARALAGIEPELSENFAQNAEEYGQRIRAAEKEWQKKIALLQGRKFIFYHNSWPYFARFAQIEIIEHVEPKPGIHPTPGHIKKLIGVLEGGQAEAIAIEPYFDRKTVDMLAEKTGVRIVEVCPSVGGIPGVDSYLELIEYNLRVLVGE